MLGTEKHLYFCGIYIPPENSKDFDPQIFDDLDQDISIFSTNGFVMLLGDLNARAGSHPDYIYLREREHIYCTCFVRKLLRASSKEQP